MGKSLPYQATVLPIWHTHLASNDRFLRQKVNHVEGTVN